MTPLSKNKVEITVLKVSFSVYARNKFATPRYFCLDSTHITKGTTASTHGLKCLKIAHFFSEVAIHSYFF